MLCTCVCTKCGTACDCICDDNLLTSAPAETTEVVAAKSFAVVFKAQLEAKPKLKAKEQRLLDILNSPPSKRRDRQIARMENHAKAAIDADPRKAIDWSTIDWSAVLTMILTLLIKLLPLIFV